MTEEEARAIMIALKQSYINLRTKSDLRKKTVKENIKAYDMAIEALEQKPNIKSLGEELRICRESITDEKVLIGFNMAVALCNKYFAGSEVQE